MLFDEIMKRYKTLLRKENEKGDYAHFQFGDAGIEMTITKNGKKKTIKEQ